MVSYCREVHPINSAALCCFESRVPKNIYICLSSAYDVRDGACSRTRQTLFTLLPFAPPMVGSFFGDESGR